MTLFDAIRTNPTFINIPTETIELAFSNRGYEMTDDYTVALLENLELVTADLYVELATSPNFQEGDLSVAYNSKILMRRARNIYLKYEDDKAKDASGTKLDLNITKR